VRVAFIRNLAIPGFDLQLDLNAFHKLATTDRQALRPERITLSVPGT
jgi:hypothetical protein